MFEIKNVSKKYNGEYALSHVSLTIGKGLNFIIGSSGSGKTTLLKIMSGMEQDFEGEVLYCGKSIKSLTDEDKSYFYNSVFGFVWQDFNLLDDLTVLENVMLPQYLKSNQDEKTVLKVLKELKISELTNQKVAKLSGGQKQRVAIARELIKNPQVIIADEPTSALDAKAAKATMEILRAISRTRTVIIVTHDTSLIDSSSNVYELDKGILASYTEADASSENISLSKKILNKSDKQRLSVNNACITAKTNIKSRIGRFSITAISILTAAVLLLVTVSGAITDSSQGTFEDLYKTYGDGIFDLNVVGSFMSAGGTDGSKAEKPNTNVTQDIGGLYDKYLKDDRVEHIVLLQAFNDINVAFDGKKYKVETSNSVPAVNHLTKGKMPMGNEREVVVPNSFIKRLGISEDQAIGKKISFSASIYNWDSGQPVDKKITIEATIVGVMDTTVKYEAQGKVMEYTVDDSFVFSKSALTDIRSQAGVKGESINFSIRPNKPENMISIKDELNAKGIVPIGQFELVEDMVRLNNQTKQQSGSAIVVIAILSVFITIAIALLTALMRKREYAIYKVSGYSKKHLGEMTAAEFGIASIVTSVLFVAASPLINMATKGFWGVNILKGSLLSTGVLLVVAMAALSFIITTFIASSTNTVNALKTGDR